MVTEIRVSTHSLGIPDYRGISMVDNYDSLTVVDLKPPLSKFGIVIPLDYFIHEILVNHYNQITNTVYMVQIPFT